MRFAQFLMQQGWGRGSHPLPETATARTGEVRAVALLLLIMSKAQMGLIACKVSGGRRRYERALDFGNETNSSSGLGDRGQERKAGPSLRLKNGCGQDEEAISEWGFWRASFAVTDGL